MSYHLLLRKLWKLKPIAQHSGRQLGNRYVKVRKAMTRSAGC
jgi:hypothetical protein